MKVLSRLAIIAFGLTLSTAVSAEQVALLDLQCVPEPPLTVQKDVICPEAVSGLVELEECSCDKDYLLVKTSATGAISTPFENKGGGGGTQSPS